ncbi:MAG: DUF1318 domain-containing protein [Verrucomicrobiae bacterium]|nr:DUF1318 domain-containing protein [Verrucomicrobiae bacterium]
MDDFNDSADLIVDPSIVEQSKPYRMHARVAWILMAIVAVIALVPVLGFASWFIAGPMMLISFIMIILVFVKGGVAHGLALLACQIIVMPVIVIFGPMITSAFGLFGTAAGVGAALESTSNATNNIPSSYDTHVPSTGSSSEEVAPPVDSGSAPIPLPADLMELKARLLEQQHSVSTWVRTGLAVETPSGFLKSGDSADIETRKSVQQQNLWREQVFARIAEMTGMSSEEVAQAYVRLASGQ